jgi:hypothetical protein
MNALAYYNAGAVDVNSKVVGLAPGSNPTTSEFTVTTQIFESTNIWVDEFTGRRIFGSTSLRIDEFMGRRLFVAPRQRFWFWFRLARLGSEKYFTSYANELALVARNQSFVLRIGHCLRNTSSCLLPVFDFEWFILYLSQRFVDLL